MAAPNIPAAKRAGLPVDIDRLSAEGDGWLTPEDRYALKTHGICTQLQDNRFMVRVRIPGGVVPAEQARGLARLSRKFGPDWLHLTTRQNIEFHWVEDRQVKALLEGLGHYGLSTRSACGHTLRNVICSEDAGLGLDEPFDCLPDARAVSDSIVARSAELNVTLPSRINITFGGSPRCQEDARINDVGFVSKVVDGVAGYEMWAGGSLGKAPALSVLLTPFLARADVQAAADAFIDVFIAHGNFDTPAKGRAKFVVEKLGEDGFRAAWEEAFALHRTRTYPDPVPVPVLDEADRVAILQRVPPGGWSVGVRPQRTPGLALVTIDVPMGDTNGSEFELLADLTERHGDGHLTFSRDQNVVLRDVPLHAIPTIREALRVRGLYIHGEARVASVRACTGSSVCALGITTAPEAGNTLLASPGLGRNSALRVHVSGCPNSCAQHQAGDIGLAGSKVRIGGKTRDGYHLFLGADVLQGEVGKVVGRFASEDVPRVVEATVGAWESLRHGGEALAATVARVGHDAFSAHLAAVMDDRFETGAEPEMAEPVALPVA
jgi:sulfite reductase beta subunit-like hemoprotein